MIRGTYALRVAITNHRTRRDDLDRLVEEVVRLGRGRVRRGEEGEGER